MPVQVLFLEKRRRTFFRSDAVDIADVDVADAEISLTNDTINVL